MVDVNLNSPIDVRNAGMKALQEAMGPVGMVKFMQQYNMGYGDYTKEKQEQPDMSLEEIDVLLKNADNGQKIEERRKSVLLFL